MDTQFWGHVGLRLPGSTHTIWYPISYEGAAVIRKQMSGGRNDRAWVVVETLNNRVLAFDPRQMKRIWLLDDASGAPEGDFVWQTTMDDYAGIAPDLYRLMATWADSGDFEDDAPEALQDAALAHIEHGGFSERPGDLRKLLRYAVIRHVDGTTDSYEAERENLAELIDLVVDDDTDIVEISQIDDDFESFYPLKMLCMIDIPAIELHAALDNIAREMAGA